jgi:E3 ubiquitin-protein ligase DOA10
MSCIICHDNHTSDNPIFNHLCCSASSHKKCITDWFSVSKNDICCHCRKPIKNQFWKIPITIEMAKQIIKNQIILKNYSKIIIYVTMNIKYARL